MEGGPWVFRGKSGRIPRMLGSIDYMHYWENVMEGGPWVFRGKSGRIPRMLGSIDYMHCS
jgi:hypothetical protein